MEIREHPAPVIGSMSAIAVIVGMVIGIGIFRLPSIVATHAADEITYMLFWIIGGAVTLSGAICYAVLSRHMPDSGGEYTFLRRSLGYNMGYLFVWGRVSVIQTGSIALVAFIFGDYATLVLELGPYSSTLYALGLVSILTLLNARGTVISITFQNYLAALVVLAILVLGFMSFIDTTPTADAGFRLFEGGLKWSSSMPGLAMIFVLLSFGGWNEASYLAGELREVKKSIWVVLGGSIFLITILYLIINFAYLNTLGLDGLKNSETPGHELSNMLFGPQGSAILVAIIIISSISTANATILTGSRSLYALGRDREEFGFVGKWSSSRNTPARALIVQGIVVLALVGLGGFSKDAISAVVDYTAPVFWFFMLMVMTGFFKLVYQKTEIKLKNELAIYLLPSVVFFLTSLYMLYSSITYTGIGATFGVLILISGMIVKWMLGNK